MIFFAFGCSKTEAPKKTEEVMSVSTTDLKIKKFISISWQTPIDQVIYDEEKQEYKFGEKGQIVMSREKIEDLYNTSNEYKLNYEN